MTRDWTLRSVVDIDREEHRAITGTDPCASHHPACRCAGCLTDDWQAQRAAGGE